MLTPQQLGGKAVAQKYAPTHPCPRCGKLYPFLTPWMAWIGHQGLHALADKFFGGDIKAAQKRLRDNGRARQEESATWQNGASPKYRPIRQMSFPLEFFSPLLPGEGEGVRSQEMQS
ncbi:MAG: hypothetical protein BroJett011_62180 [Chloroflexota bacterium]|nr:MAG: hypothetical protein BroJett011_62180 [Chloroflexota bacterium]